MSLEIEIKLPLRGDCGISELSEQLLRSGFQPEYEILETDVYLDNAEGRICRDDCALRVRTVRNRKDHSEAACITYKGKKLDTVSMSRREIETGVGDPAAALALLQSLGFSPVKPEVVKTRFGYRCGRINACLDRVEGLGDFLELEIVADEPGEEQSRKTIRENALHEIENVLQQLGYRISDTVTDSYLSMLQMKYGD